MKKNILSNIQKKVVDENQVGDSELDGANESTDVLPDIASATRGVARGYTRSKKTASTEFAVSRAFSLGSRKDLIIEKKGGKIKKKRLLNKKSESNEMSADKDNITTNYQEKKTILVNNTILGDSIEETQLDLLVCQTMGLNPDYIPLSRIVPINMYLTIGDNSQNILLALNEFLESFDLHTAKESPAIISSFFKRLWARTTSKETIDGLNEKLHKMQQALEAQQIDKPKSEIDLNHAKAAEKLLNALGNDSKTTALHIGNLLILVLVDENGDKHNRIVTLTKEQIEMIQQNQNLLRKPELLLQHLQPEKNKVAEKIT